MVFIHEVHLCDVTDLEGQLEEVSSDFPQILGLDGGVATEVQELEITHVAHSIVEHNLKMVESGEFLIALAVFII